MLPVRDMLFETIDRNELPPSFRDLVVLALSQPGKVLSGAAAPRWPSIVLACCQASGGDPSAGGRAAAAVEFFATSLDILDDVEDGDRSEIVDRAGIAVALNVSTALLFLAQTSLASIDEYGLEASVVAELQSALARYGLSATRGQHRDLSAEGDSEFTTEHALEIAAGKAGSLVAAAAWIGARLGTDNSRLLELYDRWGRHYGTAAQLANDLHDAERPDEKSDWKRAKATLPLIFSRATKPEVSAVSPEDLARSGALHFTWVICEIERQRALAVLDELAVLGQDVASLKALMN